MESKIDNIIENKLIEEKIKHEFLYCLKKGDAFALSLLFPQHYAKYSSLTDKKMIFTVCEHGNSDLLYIILCFTKETNIDYNELFIKACNMGYLNIVQLLLERYKINIHCYGDTALLIASENGHLDIVKYLLSRDDKSNIEKAFVSACYGGNLNTIKYFVDNFKEKISKETIDKTLYFINNKNIEFMILLFLTWFGDKIDITSSNFKNCILCCANNVLNKDIINCINYQYDKIQKHMYEKTGSILEKCDEYDCEFNEEEKKFVDKIINHVMDDIEYNFGTKKRYRNSEEDELVREDSVMKKVH